MIGVKGDWPFVKKAMHLRTGYASKRICHLCDSQDWDYVEKSTASNYTLSFGVHGTLYIQLILPIDRGIGEYIYKGWS